MKNICFFIADVTGKGGTERVSTIIASELAKIEEYNIIFLSLYEKHLTLSYEINKSIKRFKLYEKPLRAMTNIIPISYKLLKFVKDNNIDIIVDIDGILDIFSLIVKAFTKIKVISWEHYNFYHYSKIPYRKYIRMLSGRFSDVIITLTEQDKEYYKSNIKIKGHIEAINNPILGLNNIKCCDLNSKTILSVGRLTKQKGFDMLIDIAHVVLNNHLDWKWIVLGEGEERETLENRVKELNLQNRLIFKGNVRDIDEYYKKSSILVLTSRFEGLPMTLLEGKAYQMPMVSFDIKTGPKECIINNRNGYLIKAFDLKEMEEKLSNLMEDEGLRENFSKHSLDDTKKFSLEIIIDKWKDIFREIM